jgi:opacity protein-like surface antigen
LQKYNASQNYYAVIPTLGVKSLKARLLRSLSISSRQKPTEVCMIRRLILALGVLAVTAVGAIAADLPRKAPAYTPPPPVFNWTGFYVGGGLGLRSTETDWNTTSLEAFGNPVALSGANSEPLNGTAFRYSGYLGYNWQFAPQWLIGIEGDVGGGNKTVTLTGGRIAGRYPISA